MFKELTHMVAETIYPENIYCIRCGDIIASSLSHGLCDICSREIPWRTSDPFLFRREEFAFDSCMPCAVYGQEVRSILHGFKLSGKTYIARNMGLLMAERLSEELVKEELIGVEENVHYDFITEVPMHRDKRRRRGYNQSYLLAAHVSEICGLKHVRGVLEKTRPTQSMRTSDAIERRSVLADSIGLSKGMEGIAFSKCIVLVDDVVTTGITADTCARILKEAGALRVDVLCFAASAGMLVSGV